VVNPFFKMAIRSTAAMLAGLDMEMSHLLSQQQRLREEHKKLESDTHECQEVSLRILAKKDDLEHGQNKFHEELVRAHALVFFAVIRVEPAKTEHRIPLSYFVFLSDHT
jgi:hypothetical protein